MKLMNSFYILLSFGVCLAASADELRVELEIPQIKTAEYHRPYVAVWIEDSQRQIDQYLALWLEQEKWHRDLRYWWRRGGKNTQLPIDGISGATRKPGLYRFNANIDNAQDYKLVVEAVREVGGRELIKVPLAEIDGEKVLIGERELGQLTIKLEK
ncbi:DUF2271 domain-containing protein [Agaribacterium sp. ZY112]|uniref:DUF2271 domain-containing protein n=1 Tax=Agaribacterium sp. ZY112 TaxID=3233574 RepID=UPI003524F9EB